MSDPTPNTQHPTPIPGWLSAALLPLSWLYAAGLEAYLLPYRLGIRGRCRLPCRVVSVGNLTFGGTGKSPAVRAICEKILERGLKPAILSRGHGGMLSSVGAIVSDGEKRQLEAADCGDEPALLADALPGVPVAIGKDRREIGRILVERFKPDIVVLDDGMQYWQLHRDVEIVLLSAERPFGNGRLLPAGDLREPARGIRRADAVVVTRTETRSPRESDPAAPDLADLLPGGVEVFLAKRSPRRLIDCGTGEHLPVRALRGMPVVAVSGIACPWSFEAMLRDCGAEIREALRFGDHCDYSEDHRSSITKAAERTGGRIVTTAKDAVKLKLPGGAYVLDIELEVEDADRLADIVVGSRTVESA